ncbi:MAG: hypothetical protein HY958_13355 [Bacteroidia bacterium]|nr:hypothetical protein [Bacteroidia bacterium]
MKRDASIVVGLFQPFRLMHGIVLIRAVYPLFNADRMARQIVLKKKNLKILKP